MVSLQEERLGRALRLLIDSPVGRRLGDLGLGQLADATETGGQLALIGQISSHLVAMPLSSSERALVDLTLMMSDYSSLVRTAKPLHMMVNYLDDSSGQAAGLALAAWHGWAPETAPLSRAAGDSR
jgi:hypothetical protein